MKKDYVYLLDYHYNIHFRNNNNFNCEIRNTIMKIKKLMILYKYNYAYKTK